MEFSKTRNNIIRTLRETDFPKDVIVETTAFCNLKCIMCPQKDMTRPRGNMSFETFKKIADEVALHPKSRMWLAIMGEPLLDSPALLNKIKYAKTVGVGKVCLNTNSTLMTEDVSNALIRVGLDEVLIGLDAFNPDTYEKIRVGGNLNRVLSNILCLVSSKDELGSTKPEVIIQYIVMEENKGEVEDFKAFWVNLGSVVVKIRPRLGWRVGSTYGLDTDQERYPCPWLINAASIQWNGKFNQCDGGWSGDYSPGDINTQTIEEVWNGELKLRREKHWAGDFSHPLCKECNDWKVPKSKFYYPRKSK